MYKLVFLAICFMTFCLHGTSLPCGQDWSALSSCLQMSGNHTSADDILKFIRSHGYMIVPTSNPVSTIPPLPTKKTKRSAGASPALYTGKCPYKIQVQDLIDTVPRFVSNATCNGCDIRCKPVVFTQRLLRKKCHDFWLWDEQDVRVAYYLGQ